MTSIHRSIKWCTRCGDPRIYRFGLCLLCLKLKSEDENTTQKLWAKTEIAEQKTEDPS